MIIRAIVAGVLAAMVYSFFHDTVRAEAPTIWDEHISLRANVVPAIDWCSQVVSVDLKGTRQVFEKSSEEVQRFIGGIRASVLYDCPLAELIRIHGIVNNAGVFLAYTQKSSSWSIRVFPSVAGILSTLSSKEVPASALHDLGYFETWTLFDRARIENIVFQMAGLSSQPDHVQWEIEGVYGSTDVLKGLGSYRSLTDVTNSAAHIFVDGCVNEGNGFVRNATSEDIASNVKVRTFECIRRQASSKIGVIVKEVANFTLVFSFESEHYQLFDTLFNLVADKKKSY